MSGTAAPAQRTPEERARVLAIDVVTYMAAANVDRLSAEQAVATIEPLLVRALREAERAALWDVILHLSLELERKARPGGAALALASSRPDPDFHDD